MRQESLIVIFLLLLEVVIGQSTTVDYREVLEINQTSSLDTGCNSLYEAFLNNWSHGEYRLTVTLDYLKRWNCHQYEVECRRKSFAYNNYTKLVYIRFCHNETFEANCTTQNKTNGASAAVPSSCEQVKMYKSPNNYVEFVIAHVPFCNVVWCGFDVSTVEKLHLSPWSCLASRCGTNIIVIMVVAGLMAVVTIFVNILVILVIDSYPNSCSRQLMLKKSLAVGDFICGLLVLPTFLSTIYLRYVAQRNIKENIYVNSLNVSDNQQMIIENQLVTTSNLVSSTITNSDVARDTSLLEDVFPYWYLAFVGCFISLTMMVSVYTLLFSSLDQFTAIRRPIAVSEIYALRLSKFLIILPWVVAIAFSLIPIFVNTLKPYEVITGLVIARGRYAVLFYCMTFLLPLVLTWLLNLLSWMLVKKNEKQDKSRGDSENVQKKLVATLTEMITLFTICVLPAGISIVIHIALHDNNVNNISITNGRYYDFELVATLILLSKGIWYCFLYNFRSVAFRNMANENLKAIFYSCCCYQCCRKAQASLRRIRRRLNQAL